MVRSSDGATVISGLVWIPVLIAFWGPIAVIGRSHVRRAALVAFAPALVLAAAALISSETAWGHRPVSTEGFSNTANLIIGAVVLAVAGTLGFAISVGVCLSARRRARRVSAARPYA